MHLRLPAMGRSSADVIHTRNQGKDADQGEDADVDGAQTEKTFSKSMAFIPYIALTMATHLTNGAGGLGTQCKHGT